MKLLDIVQRITDLVFDRQRDQDICIQIGISVGMKVRSQFYRLRYIRLDHRLTEGIFIILRLAHQRFRNRRNQRIDLDLSVRINVSQFRTIHTENVHSLAVSFDVTRNLALNDRFSILENRLLIRDCCKVIDQVLGLVIDRRDRIGHSRLLHIQMDHDIFFFI